MRRTFAKAHFLSASLLCIAGLCLLLEAAGAQTRATATSTPPSSAHDPLVETAFDHFYNMDYDRSIQEFEKVLDRHPNDPSAVNHLLATTLMRELYRMGAMNTGEYATDSFIGQAHRPADPKVKEQIKQLVDRAETLEEQQLKDDPNNVDALYARGVTRAQFSLYTALVERAWFSALRNAVGARRDHERVLELNPNYVDAKLVVGAHNYVMGSLPWSVKVAVAMVGLSGTKEKGLQYLREVANSGGENSVDAKVVLALFLRRERRFDESRKLMHDLSARYPGNYLFPAGRGQSCCAPAVTFRRPLPSIAESGKTDGKGSTALYITRSLPGPWASYFAARKIIAEPLPPTNWWAKLPLPIPKPSRKPIWPPAKCTTNSSSAIWP